MAFVISVPILVPIPIPIPMLRFQCRDLQMAAMGSLFPLNRPSKHLLVQYQQ